MENSSYEREGRDGSAQHDLTGRRSNEIRRATERAPSTTIRSTLAEDRIFGRRAGFIGFSVLAHLALLLGIMLNSNLIPAIRELGGGDGQAAGIGSGSSTSESEISIVEVTDLESGVSHATTADISAPDPSSPGDVVVAKISDPAPAQDKQSVKKAMTPPKTANADVTSKMQVQELPAEELTARTGPAEQVPAEETLAEETLAEETPPTLLADPPQAQPSSDEPVIEKAVQQESQVQAVTEQESQPSIESSVATQPEAEAAETPATENKDLAAAASASTELPTGGKGGPSETETAGAGDNQNQGPGAGVVINGPIRDAGELRALAGNPNPIYPARDRLRRNEGTAVVLGQVAADGRVSRVVLEKSSGSKDMDLESAKAFKNWRFQSGQAGWVRKPFQFRLVGQAKEVPAPLGEVLQRKSGALGK